MRVPHPIRLLFLTVALLCLSPGAAWSAQKFVFVHDRGAPNQVYSYKLAANGALTEVAGSPFATGAGASTDCTGHCQTAIYSAPLRLLFVTGSNGISVLTVSATGALAQVPGSPFGTPGVELIGVAVFRKGRNTYVYASDVFGNRIRGFSLTSTRTLVELPGSPFATGSLPVGLTAVGGFLFGVNQTSATARVFRIGKDGALTLTDTTPSLPSSTPFNLYTDPAARFLYVPNNRAAPTNIFGFKLNKRTGALTALPGSPFAVTASTASGLIMAGPYVASMGLLTSVGNELQMFRRLGTGVLQPLGIYSSGLVGIRSGAASGKLLVVASDNDALRTFRIGRNGALTTADTKTPNVTRVNQLLIVTR